MAVKSLGTDGLTSVCEECRLPLSADIAWGHCMSFPVLTVLIVQGGDAYCNPQVAIGIYNSYAVRIDSYGTR